MLWISQHAYETLQTSSQATARIKREEGTVSEEQQQDAKYQLRSRRKGEQKPVGPGQDGKKKSTVVTRCPAANQDEDKVSGGALRASAKSESAAGKPGQVPQKDEEVMTRKLKQLIGKYKTVAVAAASQPGSAKEPQQALCLRRSKRIVNRK